MADGFSVDLVQLRSLSGSVRDFGTRAGSLADALAAMRADTGRGDSDEMGRLGPTDAADLVRGVGTQLADDADDLTTTADRYDGYENEVVWAMEHLI